MVAALWPERVEALVTGNSYNIQNIPDFWDPLPAAEEAALWYQYYFHSERGRRALERNRHDIARLLWRMWSPTWAFDAATFDRTAAAFDNPDFVNVVIHSYRHRFGLVPGDPAYAHIETQLIAQPPITVATISIDGDPYGVNPGTAHHSSKFTGPHEHRVLSRAGHNLPQERPAEWASAVLSKRRRWRADCRDFKFPTVTTGVLCDLNEPELRRLPRNAAWTRAAGPPSPGFPLATPRTITSRR